MNLNELKLLNLFASDEDWKLTKTEEGRSKESYIAESKKRKVFVKYDVDGSVLEILGNLKVAPKLLLAGEFGGRKYVIQEYVDGSHPNKEWVVDNLERLGRFFHNFHYENKLNVKLVKSNSRNTSDHIKKELDKYKEWISNDIDAEEQSSFFSNLDLLRKTSAKLEESSLVVVHADPNLTNFIVDGNQFYMIDWDDVLLADEMKDISKFLAHSFVPKSLWKVFFDSYGIKFDRAAQTRFYWWLAFGELNIAYWAATAGYKDEVSKYMKQFDEAFKHLKECL